MTSRAPARVLDACALIAFFRAEQGWRRVAASIRRGHASIHAVNLCEVFYDALRSGDDRRADTVWGTVARMGLVVHRDMDDAFLAAVGRWKVRHRISLADAFALALAERLEAVLQTTDHSEFDPIDREGEIRFEWLR
ncbi:MAG: PIN domain-containing protein [Deltaproteobacteria bacterium]|nr:PIN domain-containing protein [Deltaproteobacteria bacterium]